jgi:hypothetical protein
MMGNVILQSSTVSDEYTHRGVTGMVRVQHNSGIAKQAGWLPMLVFGRNDTAGDVNVIRHKASLAPVQS